MARSFARSRADALVAVLGPGAPGDAAGLRWAADAGDALGRLAVHAGAEVPADAAASLARAVETLSGEPAPAAATAAVADLLAAAVLLRDALPGEAAGREGVSLIRLAEAAGADAEAAGRRRGAVVALDISIGRDVTVPRAVAGPLLDTLGRVLRDTVLHGAGGDAAVRLVAHTERDVLIVVVSDRGRTDGTDAGSQIDPRRAAGFAAAGGCIAAAGGDLSAGVGSWGGVSVTVRVPLG